jgi:hypothetical protein
VARESFSSAGIPAGAALPRPSWEGLRGCPERRGAGVERGKEEEGGGARERDAGLVGRGMIEGVVVAGQTCGRGWSRGGPSS